MAVALMSLVNLILTVNTMKTSDQIQNILKMNPAEIAGLINSLMCDIQRIKPSQNRQIALSDVRRLAEIYFIGEMRERFPDEYPVSHDDMLILIDQLFEELGVHDMPPRRFKPVPSKKEKFTEL